MIDGRPSHARFASRTPCSAASALVAVLVGLSLFADVSQAGTSYVYCRAMDAVMGHACCGDHGQRHEPAAQVRNNADCCQLRHVPALAPSLAPARSQHLHDVPPPLLALASVSPRAPAALAERNASHAHMRTAPPASRVRARLMVFRI